MSVRPVILCAGSLHHDVIVSAPGLPRLDQTLAGTGLRHAFGGKGGNQAVAAARAGAEVHMAGAVGSDDIAGSLRAALDAAGVRRAMVQTHPGASGISVAITLPGGGYGAVIVSGANLRFRPEAVTFPRDCRALLLQSEIAEAANLALATRARAAGIRVILNAAPARPVDVVSTHGAGDAFLGGLAAEWARRAPLDLAAAFGQAAAALHVGLALDDRPTLTEATIRRQLSPGIFRPEISHGGLGV